MAKAYIFCPKCQSSLPVFATQSHVGIMVCIACKSVYRAHTDCYVVDLVDLNTHHQYRAYVKTESTLDPKLAKFIDKVFYDPMLNQFIQFRGVKSGTLICGMECNCYEDAKRTYVNKEWSIEAIKRWLLVEDIANFPFAIFDSSLGAYKVK
jgi:DNA-directed RNA polymerase subunit M/transcription elongation factor TFIIS